MRIDGANFSGACRCGKEHIPATRLCVIESGALAHLDEYMAELGLSGKRCAVYDGNTYAAIPPGPPLCGYQALRCGLRHHAP